MSSSVKEGAGYLLGFIVFICAIPLLMFLLAGRPAAGGLRLSSLIVCTLAGVGLSVWSIVYMKQKGHGNPMDAFNHQLAPRTSRLMTEGPYSLCRNPMLLGVFIFYAGLQLYLLSWRSLAVFAVFVLIMGLQVKREEQRLERDFGAAYRAYCKRTPALIPRLRKR